jgi:hypothetical protein
MIIFLGVHMMRKVVERLRLGGYSEDTPIAVVYKASWPEQKIIRGTLRDIAEKVEAEGVKSTAIIIVGEVLEPKSYNRSKLYDASFTHALEEVKQMFERGVAVVYVTKRGRGTAFKVKEALEKAGAELQALRPREVCLQWGLTSKTDFSRGS